MSAVRLWLEGNSIYTRPPDEVEVTKGHGRLEKRELWWVESEELGQYLEQEYDWPGLRWWRLNQAEASEIDSSGMGRGRAIVGSWGKYTLFNGKASLGRAARTLGDREPPLLGAGREWG